MPKLLMRGMSFGPAGLFRLDVSEDRSDLSMTKALDSSGLLSTDCDSQPGFVIAQKFQIDSPYH